MQTPRWRRIRGKGGYVTGLILDSGHDRHDSDPDEWATAWAVRTDSSDEYSDEADRREANRALEDFDRDRRMQNHRKPLSATKDACTKGKQKKRPQGATVPRRDGISDSAQARMNRHLEPLKFSKQ